MSDSDGKYMCPECGGGFPEPVEVTTKSLVLGTGFVEYDAKGCPWCGEAIKGTAENPRETTLFGGNHS